MGAGKLSALTDAPTVAIMYRRCSNHPDPGARPMNLATLAVNVLTGPSMKMDQVGDGVEILVTGETGSIVGIRNLADCTGTRFDVALSGGTQELRRYHFRNLRLGA